MAKERRPAVDYAIYLTVRLVVCVVQALPPSAARAVAGGLAWLAYRVDRRHREVARDNLRHAFPDADARRIDRLVRDVYDHFCTVIIEIIRVPRKLHPNTLCSRTMTPPVRRWLWSLRSVPEHPCSTPRGASVKGPRPQRWHGKNW